MFPPSSLPLPGEVLLVTDELLAPADFLLHRLLAGHLKESGDSTSVLVSVSEDIERWKAIAAKSVALVLPITHILANFVSCRA